MEILFILLHALIGSVLAKYFYFLSNNYKKDSLENNYSLMHFDLIPFISIKFLNSRKGKKLFFSEMLGIVSISIFALIGSQHFKSFDLNFLSSLVFYIFYLFDIIALLYIAIYNLINLEINEAIVSKWLFSAVSFNALIGLTRYVSYRISGNLEYGLIHLGNIDNLLFGLFLYLILLLLVKYTDLQELKDLDPALVSTIGFCLGIYSIVPIIVSLILVFFNIISRKIIFRKKPPIIPILPFILIGFTVALTLT